MAVPKVPTGFTNTIPMKNTASIVVQAPMAMDVSTHLPVNTATVGGQNAYGAVQPTPAWDASIAPTASTRCKLIAPSH